MNKVFAALVCVAVVGIGSVCVPARAADKADLWQAVNANSVALLLASFDGIDSTVNLYAKGGLAKEKTLAKLDVMTRNLKNCSRKTAKLAGSSDLQKNEMDLIKRVAALQKQLAELADAAMDYVSSGSDDDAAAYDKLAKDVYAAIQKYFEDTK